FPPVGLSNPASRPSRVDLPEPERPMIATRSPCATARFRSCNIVNRASLLLTCLFKATASTAKGLCMSKYFRFRFIRFFSLLIMPLVLALSVTTPQASPATTGSGASVLVFGDSLSAAYGIQREQGWVALLQRQLEQQAHKHKIINASISGETTSGGL